MFSTQREEDLTLDLLEPIEQRDEAKQHYLAGRIGFAAGLAIPCFSRCPCRELRKARQAPAVCHIAHLRPKGFVEKSSPTADHLSVLCG